MIDNQPHVALFGTSADPPTTGHEVILNWLSRHYDWVAVWASNNPFKAQQISLSHRMTMLQLLVEDLNPPKQNVHVYPQLSHARTLHTVEVARRLWPNAIFTLVIGSDLLQQLPQWYQVEALLQQVNLLVVPRPGYPLSELALSQLRQQGAKLRIADLQAPNTSSTAYRQHGDTRGIAPPIEHYIHQQQLYAWQDDPREKQPIR